MRSSINHVWLAVVTLTGIAASIPAAEVSTTVPLVAPSQPRRAAAELAGRSKSYKVPTIGFHHLLVPNTRTRLNYVFLNTIKINSAIVADTMGNFTHEVRDKAKVHDGTIPDDRFFRQNRGLFLCAHSVRKDHLTWGVLGAALKGLGTVLGTASSVENYKAAWFDIFDSDWGNVGRGTLSDNIIDVIPCCQEAGWDFC